MNPHFDGLELDFFDIEPISSITRREFIKLATTGIVITFGGGTLLFAQEGGRGRFRPRTPGDFNAFLAIGEDGRVTCLTGKIEMGQGIITSLPQMLADELEVPLERVDIIMGDTDLCPFDNGTFGSLSTRVFGPALRAAAAEARTVLVQLAADELQLPVSELRAKDGAVESTKDPSRKKTYAELTKGKKIERHLDEKAILEKASDFSIVGKSLTRRDGMEKVTGKAKFAADMRFPGMLYARILRPPGHGATLKSADTSKAEAMAGVQVVRDGDLIAVLAEHPGLAEQGRDAIKAEWNRPSSELDDKNIFDHIVKQLPEGRAIAQGGRIEDGKAGAAKKIATTYLNSYVAHAPMEPHAATAKMDGDRVIVYAGTQRPFPVKEEIARTLGLPSEQVRVIPPFLGGGFGGKSAAGQAIEAARLTKLTERPVQVAWTREEEFFYDTFRPAAVVKIDAGVGDDGRLAYWDYAVYAAGSRGSEQFYDIPNHRTAVHGGGWGGGERLHPFATGAWRAPANNTNTYARECHIEALAAAAGMDPVEFRLKNLKDARMIGVLKAAAKKFGYQPKKGPSGRGIGVSLGIDAGSYVAHIAEVEVDKKTGKVQVKRVVCAQDMGLCINPEGATIQMEGCITMGLGYALAEEVHFKGGEIKDTNFGTYSLPRFSWMPVIETVIVDSPEPAPQGGGEPAIICMGAVVANGIFDATGARVLQLPMTPERVNAAIAEV